MAIGLAIGAIADNNRNRDRRPIITEDEDEIDYYYYGDHYPEEGN